MGEGIETNEIRSHSEENTTLDEMHGASELIVTEEMEMKDVHNSKSLSVSENFASENSESNEDMGDETENKSHDDENLSISENLASESPGSYGNMSEATEYTSHCDDENLSVSDNFASENSDSNGDMNDATENTSHCDDESLSVSDNLASENSELNGDMSEATENTSHCDDENLSVSEYFASENPASSGDVVEATENTSHCDDDNSSHTLQCEIQSDDAESKIGDSLRFYSCRGDEDQVILNTLDGSLDKYASVESTESKHLSNRITKRSRSRISRGQRKENHLSDNSNERVAPLTKSSFPRSFPLERT